MSKIKDLQLILRCPSCHSSAVNFERSSSNLICEACGAHYPVSLGCPVLLRSDNAVFCRDDYLRTGLPLPEVFLSGWGRLFPAPSINLASERVLTRVRQFLAKLPSARVLVVGSGRQRQWLDERLGGL